MATIADLRKLVSETKPEEAAAMTSQLLAEGEAPMKVLEDGVMRGLSEVGDRSAAGEAIVLAASLLVAKWLFLYFLYKRKIFFVHGVLVLFL